MILRNGDDDGLGSIVHVLYDGNVEFTSLLLFILNEYTHGISEKAFVWLMNGLEHNCTDDEKINP